MSVPLVEPAACTGPARRMAVSSAADDDGAACGALASLTAVDSWALAAGCAVTEAATLLEPTLSAAFELVVAADIPARRIDAVSAAALAGAADAEPVSLIAVCRLAEELPVPAVLPVNLMIACRLTSAIGLAADEADSNTGTLSTAVDDDVADGAAPSLMAVVSPAATAVTQAAVAKSLTAETKVAVVVVAAVLAAASSVGADDSAAVADGAAVAAEASSAAGPEEASQNPATSAAVASPALCLSSE